MYPVNFVHRYDIITLPFPLDTNKVSVIIKHTHAEFHFKSKKILKNQEELKILDSDLFNARLKNKENNNLNDNA